jgi:hypothetical protein
MYDIAMFGVLISANGKAWESDGRMEMDAGRFPMTAARNCLVPPEFACRELTRTRAITYFWCFYSTNAASRRGDKNPRSRASGVPTTIDRSNP